MSNNQTSRDDCYFCGGGEGVLETHHIVPKRHAGSDRKENLVDLCPTCHERLERLYNKRFYARLGVGNANEAAVECLKFAVGFLRSNTDISANFIRDFIQEHTKRFRIEDRFCSLCWQETFYIPREDGEGSRCCHCETTRDEPPSGTLENPPGWFDD